MIKVRIAERKPLLVKLKNVSITNAVVTDPYEGTYVVVPSDEEQILPTRHKGMQDDVTIREIPMHEVSNETGITLVIGG